MNYEPKTFHLKDSSVCILRSLLPEEAETVNRFMKQVYGESDFLMRYPEEVTEDSRNMHKFLKRNLEDLTGMCVGAFINGALVGHTQVTAVGKHLKTNHRCSLAIAVRQDYWHLGIGRLLIEEDLRLAAEMGYEQIELGVFADNKRAQHLYESCGFETWGVTPHAFKLKDGSYRSEITMGRFLSSAEQRD